MELETGGKKGKTLEKSPDRAEFKWIVLEL